MLKSFTKIIALSAVSLLVVGCKGYGAKIKSTDNGVAQHNARNMHHVNSSAASHSHYNTPNP